MKRREACLLIGSAPLLLSEQVRESAAMRARPWLGSQFWSNPLQDWRWRQGRIECITSGGDRNVYLLTRELSEAKQGFSTEVLLGRMEDDKTPLTEGFAGFRIGIRGHGHDYRDSAVYGYGLNAGITTRGQLFIGEPVSADSSIPTLPPAMRLRLDAEPSEGEYRISLSALDSSGQVLATVVRSVPGVWLVGGLALVCSHGPVGSSPDPASIKITPEGMVARERERGGNVRFWFRDWSVSGGKVEVQEDRAFGPILWTMYTVSRGVLKLSAQMAPVSSRTPVHLQIQIAGAWKTIASAEIDALSCQAVFRVPHWDATRDAHYRVFCTMDGPHEFSGVIRRDPIDQPKLVLAALSCLNDFGFPHGDLVASISRFRPDLLAFEGDQIYERVAGYGLQRFPLQEAALDYLRKWYLFGWSFRDLMPSTPTVCMADDHDVFQGNVWGAGGRHAEGVGIPGQDTGGYVEPAAWVNMIQRTQTSHLPDPVDPTPIEQGIHVYYTHLCWGGVSFAILEDRKWKSAPKMALPHAGIVNGWAQNPDYSAPRDGNVPGTELLGPRQLAFLNTWAQDWRGGIWLKAVLSQTLFSNVATLPQSAKSDAVVPHLPILKPGEYAPDDVLVADHDSNGWPQHGREAALRAFRRCSAFHVCGDQHLGSTVQYGIDGWGDAAFALCSPALSNYFPRRWYPPEPGGNPLTSSSRNTGNYTDGFGNKVTVHAVFNPEQKGTEPNLLLDRSPGFGIVEMDRQTSEITFAIWARGDGANQEPDRPVAGWPVTIRPLENGWARSPFTLDAVESPQPHRCASVMSEPTGEILYTIRLLDQSFVAPVPAEGLYSVRLFDPDTAEEKWFRHLSAKRKV